MVLAHFAKLLELPIDSPDLLIKEARHKFQGTYMVLNGELQQIAEIFGDNLQICNITGKYVESPPVETLVPFLPPTGMYFPNEHESISLRKFASKQWRKSFCWDLYSTTVKNHDVPFKVFQAIKENNANTFNGVVFNKGTVYYLDKEIGTRDSNNIYHVIPEFYQELVDLFGEDRVQVKERVKPAKKKVSSKKEETPLPSGLGAMQEINLSSFLHPAAVNFSVSTKPYSIVDDPIQFFAPPEQTSEEDMFLNYFKGVINGEVI